MSIKAGHDRLRSLITEALGVLCRNGLSYKSSLTIEGLLGITLDNDNIFLVNIKESFASSSDDVIQVVGMETIADVTEVKQTGDKSPTDSLGSASGIVIGGCKGEHLDDTMHLSVGDLQSSYTPGKYSDLDILLGTGETRSKSQTHTDLVVDPSGTLFNPEELEQIINASKGVEGKETDMDCQLSDSSDVVCVKQENFARAFKAINQINTSTQHITETIVTVSTPINSEVILPVARTEELPGCSSWDLDEGMPLNLSEAPQDLSTSPKKKTGKHKCPNCGKGYKTEGSLRRHKCREEQVDGLVEELAEPLNLISKPLDLTVTRPDADDIEGDVSDTELTLADQESFTCICSKTLTDYETYIDHIATCNKSKLTPYKSCDICGKYFFSTSGYLKHKRLHVGAYKFRCTICHKGFFDKTHLGAHMDSSHRKVRRFHCNICKKSFFWKHHLKRHFSLVHSETSASQRKSTESETSDM